MINGDKYREAEQQRKQKLQPVTHSELNIGSDANPVWGLSALFEACLFV